MFKPLLSRPFRSLSPLPLLTPVKKLRDPHHKTPRHHQPEKGRVPPESPIKVFQPRLSNRKSKIRGPSTLNPQPVVGTPWDGLGHPCDTFCDTLEVQNPQCLQAL